MQSNFLRDLSWLPDSPTDFKARCLSVPESSTPGRDLRMLATYALDETKLTRLARVITGLRAKGRDLKPLSPFRLAVLGNGTLDFIEPILSGSAARHGIALEVIRGDYGQIVQEALDPQSTICRAAPDAVLIALDYRALPLRLSPGDQAAGDASVSAALQQLDTIRGGISRNCGAVTIFQTLALPPEPLFGSFDRHLPGTLPWMIAAINQGIAERVDGTTAVLLDVAALAATVGTWEWFSTSEWNLAKLPFATAYAPLYGDHVARLLAALRGKARRCLVLDLDNTVWGGVIGDDGVEGIRIAEGDAIGEAYRGVQRAALQLRERGIVLAVSSKNEDATARLPFRNHPEMLLREDHIAVFQANWKDKASNISAIAQTLALGLDSFVFLDDNPAERQLVRTTLPEVAVPELPEDPALYVRALLAAGYFETTVLSEEDRIRAAFYEGNARRVALQSEVTDIAAYLRSLAMEITFQPFDEIGRARISQLINKSNQFNLTTRRYTEAEVAAAELDPKVFTLQVRLTDSVGDNGMISVIICRGTASDTWLIDTWLMSCRVLGRRVEEAVLAEIVLHAGRAGINRLIGRYIPTERNAMVRDHFGTLGFSLLSEHGSGATEWELRLPIPPANVPMKVNRIGFADLMQTT
jgi:FkbH-like protein